MYNKKNIDIRFESGRIAEDLNTSLTTSYTGVPTDDKFVTLPSTVRKIHDIRLIDGAESVKALESSRR